MIALAGAAFVIAVALPAAGQDSASARHPVRIVEVYDADTHEPIIGADVTDLITKRSTKTVDMGGAGLFVPQFVNATGAVLRITKLGYDPVGPLIVDPLVDSTLFVAMTRSAVSLPAVTTTEHFNLNADPGERSGIAARCAYKGSFCIGQNELDRSPLKNIADVLKGAPGMIVACDAGFDVSTLSSPTTSPRGARRLMTSRAACAGTMLSLSVPPKRCSPTYFVNGFEQANSTGVTDMLAQVNDDYPGQEIATIEVYDTFRPRPLKFTGNPLCGAIVIWTRRAG